MRGEWFKLAPADFGELVDAFEAICPEPGGIGMGSWELLRLKASDSPPEALDAYRQRVRAEAAYV